MLTPLGYVIVIAVTGVTAWFAHQRATASIDEKPQRPKWADRRLSRHPKASTVKGKPLVLITSIAIVVIVLSWRTWSVNSFGWTLATFFFTLASIGLVIYAIGYVLGGDKMLTWAPAPSTRQWTKGRYTPPGVIALIPSYNEDNAALDEAIKAILRQTTNGARSVEHIYVIDDGSTTPVKPWVNGHPRVTWIRQANSGKREAQATGIRRMLEDGRNPEYLLTIDSDSRIYPGAVTECLKTFTDSTVMGVTGMIIVRGPMKGLIPRLIDLEMVCGIFTTRRARSAAGVVIPCSGALSMYRTFVVVDNLDDYVTSGTYSDDRRLSHYCLRYGRCVGIDTAVVDTLMPDTAKGAWKQRVRWYKGYWFYMGNEARTLSGLPLLIRWWSTLMSVLFPLMILWAFVHPFVGLQFPWYAFVLWMGLLYAQGLMYFKRPNMPFNTRLLSWLLLTPLLPFFQLLLIRPSMYWAAWQVFSQGKTAGHWDGGRVNATPVAA